MEEKEPTSPTIVWTPRIRLGIFLLVLSYVFGWPFLLVVESVALAQQSEALAIFGTIVYVISWGLLGLSIWLAGPDTVTGFRAALRRWFRRRSPASEEKDTNAS